MHVPTDWRDITYLKNGNPRQQRAHAILTHHAVLTHLAPFDPVLAGTIPLGIDVDGSDLDIICTASDLAAFGQAVAGAFGHVADFQHRQKQVGGVPTAIGNFTLGGLPVELFAQPIPVAAQNGYCHLVVEARLLALAGPACAATIQNLKADGLKTEPAFAQYFGLPGDPYQALLDLSHAPEATLRALVDRVAT